MKKFLLISLSVLFCFNLLFLASCNEESSVNESSDIVSDYGSEISVEESKQPDPITLKIGTYNIANGREINWDFTKIANDIVKNDLDIVGFQEVDKFCQRSKFSDTMELLKEYTGMQYYAYFKCIDLQGDEAKYGQKGAYGTAILSKYPIIETNEVELNPGTQVERRLLTCAKIDVNGTEINFFNTHLTVASATIRQTEFEKVSNAVKNSTNTILVGDFNVDSFEEFEILDPLSRVNNPENPIVTYPDGSLKIDNICYSSEFTLVENSTQTYQRYHSDHVLLISHFQIIPKE